MRYHHGHHRRRSGIRVLAILAALVAVYAGVLIGVRVIGERIEGREEREPVGSLEGRFDSDDVTIKYLGQEYTHRRRDLTSILLIGIDWEEMDGQADSRYDGQADFLLLMTLDRKNKSISYLQIDRDTVTPIRIYSPFGDYAGQRTTQICLSQAFGGSRDENCRNTVWAVSNLLRDTPIDYYLAMDMQGIVALNDALGGVTLTLEDDLSMLDEEMVAGATLTLQGKQAEYFVRGRRALSDSSNQARMRRQQIYIRAAMDLIAQGLSQDMNYAGTLFDKIEAHLVTDMGRGRLVNAAYESRTYERQAVSQIVGRHIIGQDGFVEFHADEDALSAFLIDHYFVK